MSRMILVVLMGVILSVPIAGAARTHWTVHRVDVSFVRRHAGDRCRQVVYEDGSGTVCTRTYRIHLNPR